MHEFITHYLSWCLFPISLFGQWLIGRKLEVGWLYGLLTQVLWVYFALAIHQPGLLPGSLSYAALYAWNWRKWRRERRNAADGVPAGEPVRAPVDGAGHPGDSRA